LKSFEPTSKSKSRKTAILGIGSSAMRARMTKSEVNMKPLARAGLGLGGDFGDRNLKFLTSRTGPVQSLSLRPVRVRTLQEA
jgi:hypothetical protein